MIARMRSVVLVLLACLGCSGPAPKRAETVRREDEPFEGPPQYDAPRPDAAVVYPRLPDAPPSTAETPAAAYAEGEQAYALGRYAQAISAFKRGWELKPDPVFLYNIAQAYRLADDLREAVFFYRRYLALAPAAKNRAEVEQRIRELEDRLAHGDDIEPPVG